MITPALGNSQPFTGSVDDFRIYDVTKTQSEIEAIMAEASLNISGTSLQIGMSISI
jgi:hypothetical protein